MRKILKNYFFWTYPRGSFHYDVMVTLILVFIFLSPLLINYHDRPQEAGTSASEVLVTSYDGNSFIYDIGANQIGHPADETALRTRLLDRVEAISGVIQMDRYSAQKDASGRVTGYRVWAHR